MSRTFEPAALNQKLQKGDIGPLYLLIGEETFMIDEALAKLKEKVLADGLADFNLNTFYASDCSAQDIRDAVETLPMMAQPSFR